MAALSQGAVVWADLPPPAGRRPVAILTRDAALRSLTSITVAPITTVVRGIDTEVVLEPSDGVPRICAITLDNIMTVPKSLLGRTITRMQRGRLLQVFQAIRRAFDMT